jgi:hypothetical protein
MLNPRLNLQKLLSLHRTARKIIRKIKKLEDMN